MSRNKIARSIRAGPESETFDLGGYTAARCDELVQAAFVEPLSVPAQIRITFIVGAGKLGRQKYGEALRKDFCDALQRGGFDDDAGAACTDACQGKFKYQHDTGQNLLKIHVFPRIALTGGGAASAAAEEEEESDAHSFEQLCLECDVDMFQRFERSRAPAWLQKKRMLSFLEGNSALLASATAKLCASEALSASEQRAYDTLDAELLGEKISIVSRAIKKVVKAGAITSEEKRHLIDAAEEKLEENEAAAEELRATLTFLFPEDGAAAGEVEGGGEGDSVAAVAAKLAALFGEGKKRPVRDGKQHKALVHRLAKLEGAHRNLEARCDTLRAVQPITHELRNAQPLVELAVRMAPLERSDCPASKAKALPQLQANFLKMAEESRPWFSTDDEWRKALVAFKKRAKKMSKRGGNGKSRAGKGGKSSSSWSQPSRGASRAAPKKKAGGSRGGFGALMDSDSD